MSILRGANLSVFLSSSPAFATFLLSEFQNNPDQALQQLHGMGWAFHKICRDSSFFVSFFFSQKTSKWKSLSKWTLARLSTTRASRYPSRVEPVFRVVHGKTENLLDTPTRDNAGQWKSCGCSLEDTLTITAIALVGSKSRPVRSLTFHSHSCQNGRESTRRIHASQARV